MIKPTWKEKVKVKEYDKEYTAYVVRDEGNYDNFEVFLILVTTDLEIEACIDAANRLPYEVSTATCYKTHTYTYKRTYGGLVASSTAGVGIEIPTYRRVQAIMDDLNRFELLAEILDLNGIAYERPPMEVKNI